jgi:hypothetical protein
MFQAYVCAYATLQYLDIYLGTIMVPERSTAAKYKIFFIEKGEFQQKINRSHSIGGRKLLKKVRDTATETDFSRRSKMIQLNNFLACAIYSG